MPSAIEVALADPAVYELLFRDDPAAELLVSASPMLVFAVVVHRSKSDLADQGYILERFGRDRIPVFDAPALEQFTSLEWRRLFLIELLASYARVVSGPVWVRRGGRYRRHRFSEIDAARLASMLRVVDERERPGLLRRLGDLALFLTGVFPDHTAKRQLHPIELERLVRSVPSAAGREAVERAVAEGSATAVFSALGPQWYRMASAGSPLRSLGDQLRDVASHFDEARRFLNHLTDRYLFPLRDQWFPSAP